MGGLTLSTMRGKLIAGAVALVILGGGWYFFSPHGATLQTFTVQAGDFAQQVSISGTVVPARSVDLGFSQSGRISGVYAAVGASVGAGKLLAETENGDLRAAVAQKGAALAQQEAKLESLKAGTRPESVAVSEAAVASAQTSLDQANQSLLNAISDAYRAADDAVHNKVDPFLNGPHTATPTTVFLTSNGTLASSFYADRVAAEAMFVSWNADILALSPNADLSAAAKEASGNLSSVAVLLSDASALLNHAISTTQTPQATIDTYSTNVGTARTAVNAASASLTAAVTAQRAAASALTSAQKSLTLAEAPPTAADLAAQQAQVDAAQADLDNARAQLAKTMVVAPFGGVLTKMDAKTGEIVSPGQSEIAMMSSGAFQIETYIPEVSIVNVKVGNAAQVTLDAYGTAAVFDASVISIDPAETVHDGVPTYKTTLQFAALEDRIRSGMTANMMIATSILHDVISIPRGAVYQKAGAPYVQVVTDGKPVERAIVLAPQSSLGSVVVASGLSAGETIVLNPTP